MGSSALLRASTALAALGALAGAAAAQEAVPQVRTQAPGYYRMMLGDYEVTTVSDGTVPQDFDKVMTNTTPEEVRALFARSREPLPVDVSINTFLFMINTGSKLRANSARTSSGVALVMTLSNCWGKVPSETVVTSKSPRIMR